MRHKFLWDPDIRTPDGLRSALSDPYLRQRYIVDGNIASPTLSAICNSEPIKNKDGNLMLFKGCGKRRVDYILYRKTCNMVSKMLFWV